MLALIGITGYKKPEAALKAAGFIGEMSGVQFSRIPAMCDKGMEDNFLSDEIDDIEPLVIGGFAVVNDGDNAAFFDGAVAF